MTKEEIQEKINKVEEIYAGFIGELLRLKTERDFIISRFLKDLDAVKAEEIRKELAHI